jgi:hypothetical protein
MVGSYLVAINVGSLLCDRIRKAVMEVRVEVDWRLAGGGRRGSAPLLSADLP